MVIAQVASGSACSEAPVQSVRSKLTFWTVQAAGWAAYAVALLLPWLGQFTLASMLPNKLAIAATGFLSSSGLRTVYLATTRRTVSPAQLLTVAALASAVFGILWDATVAAILGRSLVHGLGKLGSLESGVPQLSGALYHALVLFTWSLGYLSLARLWSAAAAARADSTIPVVPSRLIATDGRRSLLFEAGEIDWIEADGDYVRIHAGSKDLLVRETLVRLESVLPAGFVRIHRSAIVNVSRIREIVVQPNRDYAIVLRNGMKLKASRTYSDRLRTALGVGARADDSQ